MRKTASILFFLCFLTFNFYQSVSGERNSLAVLPKDSFTKETEGDGEGTVQEEDEDEIRLSEEVFIPTSEWSVVKPGQSIPRGLHVRMDMTSGVKEAKLMENQDDSNFKKWEQDGRKGGVNTKHKFFTSDELKKAIKEIKDDPPEENGDIKGKFRSYDEIKKEFEKMNHHIKTELEIMKELMGRFSNSSDPEKIQILEDLEYYVHQIDNAINFVDMGGFNMIKSVFNHTKPEFRAMAGYLVGSACQSNPKAQIGAIESGLLHHIIQHFTAEKEETVLKKYLYALSCILRQFPFAQKKFLDLGGIEIFMDTLQKPGLEKQKVKIVSLLFDLIMEKSLNYKEEQKEGSSSLKEKMEQYSQVNFRETILEKDWCSLVPDLLKIPDWDSQEKVLMAMDLMFEDCKKEFSHSLDTLKQLKQSYQLDLKVENSENEFLVNMIKTIDKMISSWPIEPREEL